MFRTVAVTGRTDTVNAWFATRQGGRWAEQTVQAAFPNVPAHGAPRPQPARRAGSPESTLGDLAELQRRGVLTDAEAEALRARIGS